MIFFSKVTLSANFFIFFTKNLYRPKINIVSSFKDIYKVTHLVFAHPVTILYTFNLKKIKRNFFTHIEVSEL